LRPLHRNAGISTFHYRPSGRVPFQHCHFDYSPEPVSLNEFLQKGKTPFREPERGLFLSTRPIIPPSPLHEIAG
jgi:hypothetical protein